MVESCYLIVSNYNDPDKKVGGQVCCYSSSSSENNSRLNLLLPWHQFHHVFTSGKERKKNILESQDKIIIIILRLTFQMSFFFLRFSLQTFSYLFYRRKQSWSLIFCSKPFPICTFRLWTHSWIHQQIGIMFILQFIFQKFQNM